MKKILIILLLLLSGCSGNKRVVTKRPIDNRIKWMMLAPLIKKHFNLVDTSVEEIAADLTLAEYEMSRKE